MEQAHRDSRTADRAPRATQHGADPGRRGDGGGVPAADPPAARQRAGPLRETIPRLAAAPFTAASNVPASPAYPATRRSTKCNPFAETRIGHVHLDTASCAGQKARSTCSSPSIVSRNLPTSQLDATTKLATGAAFLRGAVAAFPYQIHTVLTDNGAAYTRVRPSRAEAGMAHVFDRVGEEHGIRPLTRPYPPWTNGQAERVEPDGPEVTVKTFHHPTLEVSGRHPDLPRRLRLRQTPQGAVMSNTLSGGPRCLESDPSAFKIDPHLLIPGPNGEDRSQ